MVSSRCLLGLVTLTAVLIIAAETRAEEASGSVLGKTVDFTPWRLSIFSLNGDSGFQLAIISGAIKSGAAQRFSVGLGYDDMVASSQPTTARQGFLITEQLFLLQTSCDKRFQLTLQFRW